MTQQITDVRVIAHNHFDGSKQTLYEGEMSPDIPGRCESYADRSGFRVSFIRRENNDLKIYKPAILRECPTTPPKMTDGVVRQVELDGLGWQILRADSGMFIDDRNGRRTRRGKRLNKNRILAYLNKSKYSNGYYLKINRSEVFGIEKPIPAAIQTVDGAVEWVYRHGYFTE